ncbi:MAG: amidohydrolase family protein [Bacillota bacterium]|nr:amidohydrolase family protein [Bacillota bacterium]
MKNCKYFIKCGKFFDGKTEKLKDNIQILIESDIIKDVGKELICPADSKVIDLSDLTVTPGLIDAHVHFDFVGPEAFSTYTLNDSDEMKALNILYCAQRALEGGFTTIRVIGTNLNGYGSIDVKKAIDKKMFRGSRLVIAPHLLGTTGGHGDFSSFASSNPLLSDIIEKNMPFTGNGVDFFKEAVRKEVKYGADVIKIMATGGFASPNDAPDDKQLDNQELEAIIETAKELNVPVTAHAYTSELIDNLVRMGITGIEHGSLMNKETVELMEEKGVYLVATFMPYEEVVNLDEEKLAKKHKPFREKLEKFGSQLQESRKVLIDSIMNNKMKVGYGTDIVAVYNNYDCWREFKAWRDNGIPALRTLKAATSVNSEIVERKEIGCIEAGKKADIVAWEKDIINDHEAISSCNFVMKDGIIYKE